MSSVPAFKAPHSQAAVLLYLDLDGVVHHQAVLWHATRGVHVDQSRTTGHCLFEWLPALQEVLEALPSVQLVLSSSWCVRPGYAKTLRRLPPELRSRFIGGTFHRGYARLNSWGEGAFREMSRCAQILQDVKRRRPRQWIAIDDDIEGWPLHLMSHLIACDGDVGLSDLATQARLKAGLERCIAEQFAAGPTVTYP